jgi:probable phosphoglycerate mutase
VVQVERIVGGPRGDTGLTPLGVAQAERLRDRLAATGEIAADALIASTLPRARQTAEILAPALDRPIIWDNDVQELRPGAADGLPAAEADARFGVADFEREPFRPPSPGGETWGQFVLRVSTALDRITREHAGQTVVVVCHGGVVESSFLCFFRMPTLTLPPAQFWTQNASITHWQRQAGDGLYRRWRLMRYNDTMHLVELGGKPLDWRALAAGPPAGVGRPAVPLPTEESAGR